MGDPGRRQAATQPGNVRAGAMGYLGSLDCPGTCPAAEGWIMEMVHAAAGREPHRQRHVLDVGAGASFGTVRARVWLDVLCCVAVAIR